MTALPPRSPHPRDVACPTCKAPIGSWCTSRLGAKLNKVERQHASRRRALAGTRTPFENITRLFLFYGGGDGMYRQELQELVSPTYNRATVDRWARAQIEAGTLKRTMHGRQSYLVWVGK